MNDTNGNKVYSDKFNVARGVKQRDIISLVLFILALKQLIRHDVHGEAFSTAPFSKYEP